jgi:sulfate adenylyltransferase
LELIRELQAEELCDLINIQQGIYRPLDGFMTGADYHGVVDNMRLYNGSVWTIPITLDVDYNTFKNAKNADTICLVHRKRKIGTIKVEDCFEVDVSQDNMKVYGTNDVQHPTVKKELQRSRYRVGGRTTISEESILENTLSPDKTRGIFSKRGWRTIVAFHTRNPVHRAHEHLQRVGLELCDGLFINPFLGWKKDGDFTDEAILKSYKILIENYYPKDRVYMEGLQAAMRYAGPREAIFHALIRKNMGCTHFIVGRDHAGVGNYYGKYEAQELCKRISLECNLGITILPLQEPYYCTKCSEVVSEKHCGHKGDARTSISGTDIRRMLASGKLPDERFLRPEVASLLLEMGERRFIKK